MSDVVERVLKTYWAKWKEGLPNEECMAAALSALRPGDVLSGGMVVVPETLTKAMELTMWEGIQKDKKGISFPQELWSAMLAAAKEPNDAA